MPALHVRTLRVSAGDRTLFATFQVALTEKLDVQLMVRLSYLHDHKGSREHPLGTAEVNRAGELTNAPEDLKEHERTAIEVALKEALR